MSESDTGRVRMGAIETGIGFQHARTRGRVCQKYLKSVQIGFLVSRCGKRIPISFSEV